MEEEVRDRDVHEVVVAAQPPPAEPRRSDLALLGSGQVLRLDGLEEAEARLDPLPMGFYEKLDVVWYAVTDRQRAK